MLNKWIKPLVFLICLIPAIKALVDGLTGQLGANPIERLTHLSGDWALRFLLIGLALTPLRRWFGWTAVIRLRRMIGLFAFFYASIHFLVYLVLDQYFAWEYIWEDVVKRPYITLGFSALVLLIPLAMTSTNAMMRRLGRHWKSLHRMVYVTAVLGVFHYLWLVKADTREPLIYALILLLLLVLRLDWRIRFPSLGHFLKGRKA